MEKLSQEYFLVSAFRVSVDREELLVRKCQDFLNEFKDKNLKNTVQEMENNAQEHIKLMKDKMIKLNIKY